MAREDGRHFAQHQCPPDVLKRIAASKGDSYATIREILRRNGHAELADDYAAVQGVLEFAMAAEHCPLDPPKW